MIDTLICGALTYTACIVGTACGQQRARVRETAERLAAGK